MQTDISNVFSWLPEDSAARRDFDEFIERFGSDDTLILIAPECKLYSPELASLAERIERLDVEDLFASVLTGADAVERAVEAGVEREESLRRFENVLLGADQQSSLLATLTPKGQRNRSAAVTVARQAIRETDGLSLDDTVIGGLPYLAVATGELIGAARDLIIPACLVATP
ncbi:MAG: hypothetical protein ACQESR_27550 [Planctomycetota bacterium]